jgi:hypothetical protein
MRHWIGLAIAGCATLAVTNLPPGSASFEDAPFYPAFPEFTRYDDLVREHRMVTESIRRVRWSDSLSALASGAAQMPVPVVVGVPGRRFDGEPFDASEARSSGPTYRRS